MSKLNKILVVEDDDDINNMLCALLAKCFREWRCHSGRVWYLANTI